MSEVLLQYTRAGKVESRHRADVAVVDCQGNMVWQLGDGQRPMFWRSAAKPFQVLPFVERGGIEQFGITEEEIAFMTSSHSGEERHVELAHTTLAKIGLTVEALQCGPAKPMSSKAAKVLDCQGIPYQAVHNACSGKHSGMLALAKLLGHDCSGYTELCHPVQQIMLQAVAAATRLPVEAIDTGIDGCGVPVFYLPLQHMALAYARLAKPAAGEWGESEASVTRIRNAMLAYPAVVAGTRRIDTALMEVTQGRILAKIGSEAVYCFASVTDGIGVTFKIDDGGYRAVNPAVLAVLKKLDMLSSEEYATLSKMYPNTLKNHRGDVIGQIESAI